MIVEELGFVSLQQLTGGYTKICSQRLDYECKDQSNEYHP
jgi:hypothetical protein